MNQYHRGVFVFLRINRSVNFVVYSLCLILTAKKTGICEQDSEQKFHLNPESTVAYIKTVE